MSPRKLDTRILATAAFLILGIGFMMVGDAIAEEAAKQTFVVQGLHCPPCTSTVESSLKRTKGIEAVKVDWKTKNAWITYDESVISAQQVAQTIATTPHMMGRSMHYQSSMALNVPELKDDATAEKVKTALGEVPGVAAVYAYPQQQSIAVRFAGAGKVTSADLIAALKKAGFEAAPF
ncbi:MAG: cation transporter [Planctomycetales bacterium]|nr:cation transporter [Planctomycetales bacterium]